MNNKRGKNDGGNMEMKEDKRRRKNCIVCESLINRESIKTSPKNIRGPNSITCSKICSKIYYRVSFHVYRLWKNK